MNHEYTQDLISLLQMQIHSSHELLNSISSKLLIIRLSTDPDTQERLNAIQEDILAYTKKSNEEIKTFAKIKKVELPNE